MHAAKTSVGREATPLFRLSAAQKRRGIAPALSRILREPFFPLHTRTHATSQPTQHYILSTERKTPNFTRETTLETTEDYKRSSSLGGRSQTQSRPVRRIPERHSIVCRLRSAETSVPQRQGISELVKHAPTGNQRSKQRSNLPLIVRVILCNAATPNSVGARMQRHPDDLPCVAFCTMFPQTSFSSYRSARTIRREHKRRRPPNRRAQQQTLRFWMWRACIRSIRCFFCFTNGIPKSRTDIRPQKNLLKNAKSPLTEKRTERMVGESRPTR